MDVATRAKVGLHSSEDWRRLGYGGIPGDCKNTLTYTIHPLFRSLHLSYPRIDPVLRLASVILESPASVAFLYTILYGHRERHDQLSDQFNTECAILRHLPGPEAVVRDRVSSALEKYVAFHYFRVDVPPTNSSWDAQTVATAIDCSITDDGRRGLGSNTGVKKAYFTKLDELRTQGGNKLEILNLQFRMAVTLVHELAHALNTAVDIHLPRYRDEVVRTGTLAHKTCEPWYEDQRLAEFGFAYENEVFGGIIRTLPTMNPNPRNSVDPSHPVFVQKWPGTESNNHPKRIGSKKTMTMYLVPMHFIHNIQQQRFWDYHLSYRDVSKLRVEKSIGIRIKTEETDVDPTWDSEESSEGRWPAGEDNLVYRGELGGDEAVYSPANFSNVMTLNFRLQELFERVNSPTP